LRRLLIILRKVRLTSLLLLSFLCFSYSHSALDAQNTGTGAPGLRIDVTGSNDEGDFGVAIQLVVAMTILSLGPSVIMMMTCFTRMIIVLGFVRNAIGVNSAPSSQIIVGLALFLTFFVMGPVWNKIYDDAVTPYMSATMKSSDALMVATAHMKDFMMNQTRQQDVQFFLEISRQGAMTRDQLPLSIVVPSFVLSELRTAFQMGFLIFIPFIIVDFIVASTLMSMGMMMMPPVVISMPFKLLLFVLVDGWYLVIQSLVNSFNIA
jgi:flagellar biosynthetic protein FliP|tara:strand:+ start:147 stop:938 length:792 start_codon:yes stop_codon:yes gene_type:complete